MKSLPVTWTLSLQCAFLRMKYVIRIGLSFTVAFVMRSGL